jgi:hypothetical protein
MTPARRSISSSKVRKRIPSSCFPNITQPPYLSFVLPALNLYEKSLTGIFPLLVRKRQTFVKGKYERLVFTFLVKAGAIRRKAKYEP